MRPSSHERRTGLTRSARRRRALPHAALLLLAALLAGSVIYLTWPARVAIFCEQMPELAVLAVCAATLLVFSFRALTAAQALGQDRRIAGGAAILAGLALFLAVHFLSQYRRPCAEVQKQLQPQ